MEKKELVCICCPLGCALTVTSGENGELAVSGNTCRRGEEYGKKELTNPTRIVTTTVRVKNGALPVASVKTKADIPKGKIAECIKSLQKTELTAPVHIGDIVLENVADTGVAVVATKEIMSKNPIS